MLDIILYGLMYYLCIDSQANYKIAQEKVITFFVRSKIQGYKRLIMLNLRYNYYLLAITFVPILLAIFAADAHPILIVLLIMMYVSNCILQYNVLYEHTKYFLYALPGLFFIFENSNLLYLVTFIIFIINCLLIWKDEFVLYQDRALPFTIKEGILSHKKVILFFSVFILYLVGMLGVKYYGYKIPLEELLVGFIIYLVMDLELDISSNKMLLTRVKSRFDLTRAKYPCITFDFLRPKQKNKLLSTLAVLFLTAMWLGVLEQDYFSYSLVFMGGLLMCFSILDYITQHLLLEKSIVYDNVIVRKMIEGFFVFIIFTYMTIFILGKYTPVDDYLDYVEVFHTMKIGYFVLYTFFLSFFVRRLTWCFQINTSKANNKFKKINVMRK